MLKFFVRFFAVIGFLVIALIGGGIYIALHTQTRSQSAPAEIVLFINFNRAIVEQNEPSPFKLALDDEPMVLLDLLNAIDKAAGDPHVKGLIARFGAEQPSMTHAQEIRAALSRFRAKGKFTYAFGTDFGQFGSGNRAYFLASAFENIWLQPVGTVSLTGVGIFSPFAKTALDKAGITADFMQREEFKSFMEVAQRDSFSSPAKAQIQALAGNLSEQIAKGIAESRKWDSDHVKSLMARGPFTDEEAAQEGLVTRLAYADDLQEELERKTGKGVKQLEVEDYLAIDDDDDDNPNVIALIFGTGIIMEKGIDGGSVVGENVMDANEIANAFYTAAEDKDVKAILFRVDSPGGAPAASESIRRSLVQAQKKGKPVIVSMGGAAASGGYWVAMNGNKIIADPATLTGSIGVLAGKFSLSGLMQKIGVSIDGFATAESAGMWNLALDFKPEQRARLGALLDSTYRTFVTNVSKARNIPIEKMPAIAKGRVFTGEQAVKAGLVDALGGYDVALLEVRKALNLSADAPLMIEIYPQPPSAAEKLLKLARRFGAESAMISSVLAKWENARSAIGAACDWAFGKDPIVARMPPFGGDL